MINCKDCSTPNTPDSKFCKLCGHGIEVKPEAASVKPEDIDGLLAEGYKLLHTGQSSEATYLADAVLRVDPDNTSALALKAMALEGGGDLAGAVDIYEQIVVLNPGSTIDLIKLTQLRKRLDLKPTQAELEFKSRNVVAMLSAVAAVALVVTLGISLALNNRAQAAVPEVGETVAQQNPNQATGFDLPEPKKPAAEPTAQAPGTGTSMPSPRPNLSNSGSGSTWTPPLQVSPDSGNKLPGVNDGGQIPTGNSGAEGTGGNRVTEPNKTDEPPEPPKPPRGSGTINISEHRSTDDTGGTSENAYRVGVQKMRSGDYRGALAAFQSSLSNSKNPALTHQFIARCYKNLGDSGSAKTHFTTAAQIYEKNGSLQDAKACRREIELLGG